MTAADIAQVRAVLEKHWCTHNFEIGNLHRFACQCAGWQCYPLIARVKPSVSYADHIAAVLAEGATGDLRNKQLMLREIVSLTIKTREDGGEFTLASGKRSRYFFQGKEATLSPSALPLIGELFFERLRGRGIEAVGGKAIGANPITTAISIVSGMRGEPIPGFIVRDERKTRGMEELIAESASDDGEPLLREGRRVAIVDDVATSGASCMDAIRAVRELGCIVVKVVVLVDRLQGARENFKAQGIPCFEALFEADPYGKLSICDG